MWPGVPPKEKTGRLSVLLTAGPEPAPGLGPGAWLLSQAPRTEPRPSTGPGDGHFENKIISQSQGARPPWDPEALYQPKLEPCLPSCLQCGRSSINWINCSQINSWKPIFIFVYLYYKSSHKTALQFSLPERLSELDYARVYPSVTSNHLVSPIIVYSCNTPEPPIISVLVSEGRGCILLCFMHCSLQEYLTCCRRPQKPMPHSRAPSCAPTLRPSQLSPT